MVPVWVVKVFPGIVDEPKFAVESCVMVTPPGGASEGIAIAVRTPVVGSNRTRTNRGGRSGTGQDQAGAIEGTIDAVVGPVAQTQCPCAARVSGVEVHVGVWNQSVVVGLCGWIASTVIEHALRVGRH